MKLKKLFLISIILLTILTVSAVSASDNATDDMSTADDSVLESEENEIIQSSDVDSNMKVDFVKQEENGTIHTIDENKDIYVNDHDSDYFRVKTPKQVTGTLSLYIDDKFINDKEITAKTHYLFMNTRSYNLNEGNHTWKIDYSGDDTYASKSFNGTFYLNPKSDSYVVKNPKMNVYVVTKDSAGVVYGVDPNEDLSALNLVASDYFKVKFPKEVSGTLYLYIDNVLKSTKKITAKTHYFYVNDASYNLNPGKHSWKVVYSGDGEYNTSQEEGTYDLKIKPVKVNSNKQTSKLTVPKSKVFKTSTKTKKYTVTLKADGKALKKVKIYMKITGKKYKKTFTAITNKKGQATFKITKLTKKGTYSATITYKGSKTIKSIGKKVKINVGKKKTKFTRGADIINKAEDYNIVYTHEADVNGSIDAAPLYKYLNDFRCQKGVWYWNKNNVDKTVLNTNEENTLQPLEIDPTLEAVAKFRAKECTQLFSHTRPNGSKCYTVYPTTEDGYYGWGENIAKWQETYDEVMDSWKEADKLYEEQGHRRAMLNSTFNCVGIGAYKLNGVIYWVQSFGKNMNL